MKINERALKPVYFGDELPIIEKVREKKTVPNYSMWSGKYLMWSVELSF